ncbi:MAG: hypothetical protein RBT46_00890 [Weeksellaceae bacterium]|jgi:hypothetical protein|nr:hypothetical protein [Weeksellaceae bacterium]
MGLITDMWFGLADFFKWSFEEILVPIAKVTDWALFIIAMALMAWWLYKLAQFGNDNEKDYKGW